MARPRNPQKLVPMAIVIEPHLRAQLKELTARTRVPMNAYIREAIADLVAKYDDVLTQQPKRSKG